MSQQPTISAILTYFDENPAYVHEAVQSMRSQHYPDLEVIVVDDGAERSMEAELRPFGVRYVRRENGGLSAARNTGLEIATQDWIGFLDADDVWPEDRLANMVSGIGTSGTVQVVNGMVQQFISPELSKEERQSIYCPPAPMRGQLVGGMLIRRQVFDVVGQFPEDRTMQDQLHWISRLVDAGIQTALIPEIVLQRRLHTSNLSHKVEAKYADYLRTVREIIQRRRADASKGETR